MTGQHSPVPTHPKFPRGPVVPSHSVLASLAALLLFSLLAANFVGANRQSSPRVLMNLDPCWLPGSVSPCARSAFLHLDSQAKLVGFAQPYCPPRANALSCMASPPVRDGEREAGTAGRDRPNPPSRPSAPLGSWGHVDRQQICLALKGPARQIADDRMRQV